LGWGVPNAGSPELFLSGSQLARLREPLARLAAGNDRLRLGEGLAMALDTDGGMAQPGCPAGRQVLAVAPDGRLRGCSCLPDDAAGPSLLGDDSLAELSRVLRARALRHERELAPAAMTSCGPVVSGFCHARVLRDADEWIMESAAAASHAAVGSGAGRVALASALLAGWISWGCSKPGPEEKTTPPEAGPPAAMSPSEEAPPPVEPPVEPVVKGADPSATSDATPAGTGPDRSTTNIVAPSATKPGMKPEPWVMPRCCMSHMLVPDCQCSPPPGTIPTP
ncbi:SPASM domain-containing protein, partial [Myxococcota bacterium]|nr:SPASM domain-containing protein [Myxococcota bacterium]MBU1511351.1 SPASM domain-containing protein [Myxococcota bacterium]